MPSLKNVVARPHDHQLAHIQQVLAQAQMHLLSAGVYVEARNATAADVDKATTEVEEAMLKLQRVKPLMDRISSRA
jgi:phage-related tail fiber protein